LNKVSALQATLVPAAVVYGIAAEGVARHHGRLTTYAGNSGWLLALELAAGWGLVAAGLVTWRLRPGISAGPLAVAAGFAWFAPDWVGWDGGPAWVRSVGMLASGLWLALLVHAAAVFPDRRLASWAPRALVAVVYAETAIVAIGRALFRDPFYVVDCWDNCTDNSFLIRSDPGLARTLATFDLRFALVLAFAFAALSARRLTAASGPARRLLAPVLASGVAVTALHAAHAVALLRTPLEAPSDSTFTALFLGQCLAVSAVALALGWEEVRARGARQAVERLVVELAEAPEPGSLEAALARATGDPSLRIVYRLRDGDRYVDSGGRPVETPVASGSRAVTPIVRDGRPIALLEHDRTLLNDSFQDQIGPATRLAVENEQLQAEALARLAELRESRARIVEASDAVRRQLERDLHDGAQQRLIALAFGLRLARGALGADPEPVVADALADAERALTQALTAVRAVANGLFPTALASSGLAYAVEELAELAPIRVDVRAVPDHRLAAPVEAAAYGVIREAIENAALHARASAVSVSAFCGPDVVVVDAADDGIGGADPERGVGLVDVADRVGALGGTLTILSPAGGGTRIHAEIPCA
jgi:signal transduction histidine kinase